MLAWLVIGSAGALALLIVLAVLCACVAASRADDTIELWGFGGADPVLDVLDDVTFDWPEHTS